MHSNVENIAAHGIVSGSSAAAEAHPARRLPDMAAAITAATGMIVMLLLLDWRFELVSLLPVAPGFAPFKMTGPQTESAAYVRGVPGVRAFGQTVYSFKRFKCNTFSENCLVNRNIWM